MDSSLPSSRLSSRSASALTASPALMASPTCFDRTFTRPRKSSASRAIRRCSTSRVAARSTSAAGTPLRARATLVASRSTRRRRTSITWSKLTGRRTGTRWLLLAAAGQLSRATPSPVAPYLTRYAGATARSAGPAGPLRPSGCCSWFWARLLSFFDFDRARNQLARPEGEKSMESLVDPEPAGGKPACG